MFCVRLINNVSVVDNFIVFVIISFIVWVRISVMLL